MTGPRRVRWTVDSQPPPVGSNKVSGGTPGLNVGMWVSSILSLYSLGSELSLLTVVEVDRGRVEEDNGICTEPKSLFTGESELKSSTTLPLSLYTLFFPLSVTGPEVRRRPGILWFKPNNKTTKSSSSKFLPFNLVTRRLVLR